MPQVRAKNDKAGGRCLCRSVQSVVRAMIGCAALLAAPAIAQDLFQLPPGCEATLTVQSRSCEVTHIYQCASDATGTSRSVVYGFEGPILLDKIDYETQWLETYVFFTGALETLIAPAQDPASLTELLASGIDSYDFRLTTPEGETRVVGYDEIVGPALTIDDEPLLPMAFEGRYEEDGETTITISGTQFVSARHRRFFSGQFEVTEDGDTRTWDASPIEFIYPGEPGFLSKTPRYECEASMIRFVPRLNTDPEGDLR